MYARYRVKNTDLVPKGGVQKFLLNRLVEESNLLRRNF